MTNIPLSPLFSNPLHLLVKETAATDLFKSHTKATEAAYYFGSLNLRYTTMHSTKASLKYPCLLGFLQTSHITAMQGIHPAFPQLQSIRR